MVPNLCFQKPLSETLLQKMSLRCFNLLCLWVCSLCITALLSAFFVQINWELWKMSASSGLALACKEFSALTVALLLAVMLLSAVLLNLLRLFHAFPEKFQLWWHFELLCFSSLSYLVLFPVLYVVLKSLWAKEGGRGLPHSVSKLQQPGMV